MPNHVYYIMTITGEDTTVKEFFDNHITTESEGDSDYFDFDTIIPMPAELVGTTAPNNPPRMNGKEVLPDSVEYKAWQANTSRLIEAYGYDNWYDWKIQNQGTKWGAYDYESVDGSDNVFTFQTAWSTPDPVFEKLAELYPTLQFDIAVVEEGGYFSGTITIANGEVEEALSDDLDQWKQYASEMMGLTFDDED